MRLDVHLTQEQVSESLRFGDDRIFSFKLYHNGLFRQDIDNHVL